jgi:TrwC relaxase
VALPVKALKAGQEAYWLDQIARNREEYFSGRGESPGRFVGSAAAAAGLEGSASPEQVRAMFQRLDPRSCDRHGRCPAARWAHGLGTVTRLRESR